MGIGERRNQMASQLIVLLLHITWLSSYYFQASAYQFEIISTKRSAGQRLLLGFKESPRGSNRTFECSPSGPCVPCLYSEKNDEKYRCSETGYRIPLKCVEIEDGTKNESKQKTKASRSTLETSANTVDHHVSLYNAEELITSIKPRRILDDSLTSEANPPAYITYRSCIPAVNEEKLSVIGFEGIVSCLLLISGSVVYLRRKRTAAMPGVGTGRMLANSRF